MNHQVKGLLDYYSRHVEGARHRALLRLVSMGIDSQAAESMLLAIEDGNKPETVERAFRDG